MTSELFRNDSYLKSCNSKIIKIEDDGIILDQTIFYPEAGGPVSYTHLRAHET